MTSTHFVIIVAAGTGSRVGGAVPKQFRLLGGKPILMHTIGQFAKSQTRPMIIVVLSETMMNYWANLCEEFDFSIPHSVCSGGASRFQSVERGLQWIAQTGEIDDHTKIAVHDGARPLVTPTLIDELFESCQAGRPAVIPATQSTSSVRLGLAHNSQSVDRDQVWLIQTPQVFLGQKLIAAYQQQESSSFTDDASVFETQNKKLYLHPGDPSNIKITHESDIAIAQLLIARNI